MSPSISTTIQRSPQPTAAMDRPIQLLLQLLQETQNDTTRLAIESLLQSELDWDTFLDLVFDHRVLPLVHRQIEAHYTDLFPADIRAELADEMFENTARNMVLSQKLLAAIALLDTHGIPALAFKGPALAMMVYGDISLRMFSDLDILVPSDRFLDAKTVLMEAGYTSAIPSLFLIPSERYENRLLCKLGECPLDSPNQFVHIDLHQRLVAGDFFRVAAPLDANLWQHPFTTELLGHPIQTIGAEDLLLYLCVHGAKDLWKRLSWLCDLATLLKHSTFKAYTPSQWDALFKKARDHHLESMVSMGLTLVQTVLGVSLPKAANQLPLDKDQRLLNQFVQKLVQPGPEVDKRVSLIERFKIRFQLLDSPRDKWLCAIALWQSLIHPTYADQTLIRLPRSLYGLYRLIRPFRLVREWWSHGR